VPLSSYLTAWTGDWHAVFITASVLNMIAAAMALFLLKPLRSAHNRRATIEAERATSGLARPA
jgi:OFA family oxalate/formate antiporter-like MFS transporter